MKSYIEVAKNVLHQNLHVKDGEQILVVTDEHLKEIGKIFYEAGKMIGKESLLMEMITRGKPGEEPPRAVSEAMKAANVVLCITKQSLTHTNARKEASKAGARVATMPGVTLDMLEEGAIAADYAVVEKLTAQYGELLEKGELVEIQKENCTLTFSINGRNAVPSTGVFRKPGESGNLPSGESYIAPLEDSANGCVMIDGSIAGIGVLNEPITLTIENGRLVDASGEKGKQLLAMLGDGDGRTIAEFGIGTNKKARLTGNVLEDEKVFGTVHIAFGSNKSFGGVTDAGVHVDCVIKAPIVIIDGEQVVF
ncbi:aminopeptidase [Oceanobacillus salinisoli]|uniref:aminopeptidase n=1 Tax=Oceanobacillus salinisoli TaxID=2678611 RepID=UPI0012E1DAB0|nr:aminopeptidase [Oceanobacillus salinisoli]